ncbi:MAG: LamG domain-containing protein, partial [Snowella sp.]
SFTGLQEIFAPSTYTVGLGFGLDSKGIRLQSFVGGDPLTWIALPDSTLANQWMHLAAAHDNGTVKFYLNGTELGTRNLDANFYPDWANDDYSYLIGGLNKDRIANEGVNEGLKGHIDEVRFYNQSLTGSQITGIIEKFNSGPSDITIASNVITADTTDGTVIGKLDTVGIPIDKGKYTYQLLDDAGGKFAIDGDQGDQIVVKNKSLFSYLDSPTETIKIKSTNQRNQSTEKVITIQLIQSEPENGLKAYYKLDESSNLTIKQAAIDSSGNNKHGLYNAGIIQDVQTAGAIRGELGIDGTSVSFSNWQDYINLGNQAITYGDQFTVSTWIRPTQLSGW